MMRHAESEDAVESSARDHDREITAAGRQAAQQVAQQLADLGWVADLVICSDSTRTRQTLEAMQEARIGLEDARVHLRGDLYTIAALDGQTRSHLQGVIAEQTAGSHARCILAMGHNKGWSEAASSFAGEKVKLGPCTAALLDQHAASWEEAFKKDEGMAWGLVCTISAGTAAANKAAAEEAAPMERPVFG
jgi:phosphohistidine phosphatase SixA